VKPPSKPKKPPKSVRDRRLAAALRENLRRRKAQARGREADEKSTSPQQKPR